ncbi:hypothetical protein Scep_027783 [Stephania cephalantha]|uniref:Uncharacterized protein n=1 Tax=Stephania cephalantha TaxID=152367 RepID=A0AAP0E8P1_9MAGN
MVCAAVAFGIGVAYREGVDKASLFFLASSPSLKPLPLFSSLSVIPLVQQPQSSLSWREKRVMGGADFVDARKKKSVNCAISAPCRLLRETDAENILCVGFGRDAGGTGSSLEGDHARTEEREGGQPSHVDQRDTTEEVEAAEEGLAALSREESGDEAGEQGGPRQR